MLNFSIGVFATNQDEAKQEKVVISTVQTIPSTIDSTNDINSNALNASYPVGACSLKYTAQDDFGAKIDWTVTAPDLILSVDLTLTIDDGDEAQEFFRYNTFPWFSQHNSFNFGWYSESTHTATLRGTYTTATGTIYSVFNQIIFTVYRDGV